MRAQGSNNLAHYPDRMEAGDIAAKVGVAVDTNLKTLGEGDVAIVVASDLLNEAPIWWLQLKQASEHGATIITVNGRETRLDKWAAQTVSYKYGEEVAAVNSLGDSEAVTAASNLIVFVGSEGLDADGSRSVAQAAANLLINTDHVGQANNGLVMVWPGANTQGALDMGVHHAFGPGYISVGNPGLNYAGMVDAISEGSLNLLYVAGANPVFDDGYLEEALKSGNTTVIVTDLSLSETSDYADIVLPVQSIAERDGTYTSGMRRIQRFYPALNIYGDALTDWQIA